MTTAYVNMIGPGNTGAADTNKTWNDLSYDQSAAQALLDDAGAATGWSIAVTDPGNTISDAQTRGYSGGIPTGAAAWVDELTVADSAHYFENNDGTYVISGLDDAETYDLEIYPSTDQGSPSFRQTLASLDGLTTSTQLASASNATDVISFAGVSPSSGSITITMSGAGAGYFNALRIEELGGDSTPPDETGTDTADANLAQITSTKSLRSNEAGTGHLAYYAAGSTAPADGAAVAAASVGSAGCVAVGSTALLADTLTAITTGEFVPQIVDIYSTVEDGAGNFDAPEPELGVDFRTSALIAGGPTGPTVPDLLFALFTRGEARS